MPTDQQDQNQEKDILPEDQQPKQAENLTESNAVDIDNGAADIEVELQSEDPAIAMQAEIDDLKEKLLLSQADIQNVRRRSERDVENAHKFALEKFVADLVSVADNMERAVATIDSDNDAMTAIGEGIELTLKGFVDVLGKYKVEALDPEGQLFDPEKHQAMTMVPSPDVAPNTIIEVFQKGYLLNGRLIRPAMVVVAQG